MTNKDRTDARAAFDELARMVLSEQSMDSLLERIAQLAKGVVNGADEVSITVVGKDSASTVVATGAVAITLDERQYADETGPCLDAAQGGEIASIPDMRTETRWPGLTAAAVENGLLSSLSTPIPIQQYTTAALNMYSAQAEAFDDDDIALALSFASYAGVALANMHLYESTRSLAEQLQAAMDSRAVIEQAKGVLMGQRHCTPDKAFDLLVTLSQQSNRKLRDVAQAMVDSVRNDDD